MVSDDHKGLVKAVLMHFQNSNWQRCQIYFLRNIPEDGSFIVLPEDIRGRFWTTNTVEHLSRDIRRRERVIGIFSMKNQR